MATGVKLIRSVRPWYGLWRSVANCDRKNTPVWQTVVWPLGLQKPGLSARGVANRVTKFRMASGGLRSLDQKWRTSSLCGKVVINIIRVCKLYCIFLLSKSHITVIEASSKAARKKKRKKSNNKHKIRKYKINKTYIKILWFDRNYKPDQDFFDTNSVSFVAVIFLQN